MTTSIQPWHSSYHQPDPQYHHLSKKFFGVGVCAEESSFKNIEVDALILSNSLLETQSKINHCQPCVLSIFLKFSNLKGKGPMLLVQVQSDDLTDCGTPESAGLKWWCLHGSGGFDEVWPQCYLARVLFSTSARHFPRYTVFFLTLSSNAHRWA